MFKHWISTSNHEIRVEHWVDGLEDCPESNKHVLRVSVEYINLYGHNTRINSEAWITETLLNSYLMGDVKDWKLDQVPRLTAKVLKLLYTLNKEGKILRYADYH